MSVAPPNLPPNLGGFALGDGFFGSNPPGGVHPRKALPGDFNGDGRPDVFVLGHGYDHPPFPGEAPYAILSSASGYVQAEGLDSIIGFHHGGASADMDADGDLDVFVADSFGGPFFLLNDGAGSFTMDRARIEGIGPHEGIFTAELVDVDRDGYVDLLAAGHENEDFSTRILWGDQSGVFRTLRQTILPAIPGHGIVVDIDVADTDGDGDRDVGRHRRGWGCDVFLSDSPGFPRFLMNDGSGSFSRGADVDDRAGSIRWLHIYDMDGDGEVDLVVDDYQETELFWRNDGGGRFRREPPGA